MKGSPLFRSRDSLKDPYFFSRLVTKATPTGRSGVGPLRLS